MSGLFEVCDAALVRNIDKGTLNYSQQISILQNVTEEKFNQKKQSVGGSADFYYGGLPVSGNANWNDFNEQKDKFLSEYKMDSSSNLSMEWTKITAPPEAFAAYETCIASIANKLGTYIRVRSKDSEGKNFIVTLGFYPGIDQNKEYSVSIVSTYGTLTLVGFDPSAQKIENGWYIAKMMGNIEIPFIFARENIDLDALLVAQVAGAGAFGFSDAIVPKKPRIYKWDVVETRMFTNSIEKTVPFGDNQLSGEICLPSEADAPLMKDWIFKKGTPEKAEITITKGNGDPQSSSTRIEEKHICWNIHGGAANNSPGLNATFTVRAPGERYGWVEIK